MFKQHICYCIMGHRKVFRIFGEWRSRRFFEKTHLHPEYNGD